jgi:hypothetical protein
MSNSSGVMAQDSERSRRTELLVAGLKFTRAVGRIGGVVGVSLVGSICTEKPNPKDIDFLVTISVDVDFAALAKQGRRLKGRAQQVNRGADIFLARAGKYIGRICHYRECWPRRTCRALHCGRTQHLNDDLTTLRLPDELVALPPVTIWPSIVRRCELPADVEAFLAQIATVDIPRPRTSGADASS